MLDNDVANYWHPLFTEGGRMVLIAKKSLRLFPLTHNRDTMLLSLFAGFIGQTELIIIVVIVLLLFGGRKIPELMRGLGKGMKSFKDGMAGKEEEKPQNDNDDYPQKS
jgi:sec-independent protein translocase protein TatA